MTAKGLKLYRLADVGGPPYSAITPSASTSRRWIARLRPGQVTRVTSLCLWGSPVMATAKLLYNLINYSSLQTPKRDVNIAL